MNKCELESQMNGLLVQFALTLLSVELLRLDEVKRIIPLLDSPRHHRGVDAIGIEYTRLASFVLEPPARCSAYLTDMLKYSLKNVIGDLFEVVKSYAKKTGQSKALRKNKPFFNFFLALRNAVKHDLRYRIEPKHLPARWERKMPDGKYKVYEFDQGRSGRPVRLGDLGGLRGFLDFFEAVREYVRSNLM